MGPATLPTSDPVVLHKGSVSDNHCMQLETDRKNPYYMANHKMWTSGPCPNPPFNWFNRNVTLDGGGIQSTFGKHSAAVTPLEDSGKPCYHLEDAIDHKCTDACHNGTQTFSTHHISLPGACPTKYNFVEKTTTVKQCLNDRTNLKYCPTAPAGPPIDVTVTIRGVA